MSARQIKEVQSLSVIAGDGDGIKSSRTQIPSSRKFTPTLRKDKSIKNRLEKALKEMKESDKNKKIISKSKMETVSVDTPKLISTRKSPWKDVYNGDTSLYATPRDYSQEPKMRKRAGFIIYRYLMLISWRKCRNNLKTISKSLRNSDESVSQLNIQIDVLQKLRRSESSRREEIARDFHEIQKKHDILMNENIILRDEYAIIMSDSNSLKSELQNVHNQLENQMKIHQQMEETLMIVNDKYQKEREKSKKYMLEKKIATEKATKFEELFMSLKDKFENSKMCLENLQNCKQSLKTSLESSERKLNENFNELQTQLKLNESYRNNINQYEDNEARLENEITQLKFSLSEAHDDYNRLKCSSESIQQELEDISISLQLEKNHSTWNIMKGGMYTTISALKYLANLILPALQSNLRNF